MSDDGMLKKTLVWTGALLGLSFVWVGMISLVAVLALSRPGAPEPGTKATTTPSPKPASSDAPSRLPPGQEDSPLKRRAG